MTYYGLLHFPKNAHWIASLLIFAVAGSTIASQARAQVDPTTSRPRPASPFDAWDTDNDGRVSREELPPQLRINFDRVDADHDGLISRAEDQAFRNRGNSEQQKRPTFREAIEIHADVPYAGTNNPRQTLDLFLPKERDSDEPLPLIIWIHGGGWRNGSKNGGIGKVGPLVASGRYIGASVGYRLTGEAIWPTQIHDCKAAVRWLRTNAEEYGIDPQQIGVWGSSAGGHLVAMLGVSGDAVALEGEVGGPSDVSSQVQCVVDYYGPTEFLSMNDFESKINHDAADSPESLLVGGAIHEKQDIVRSASPLSYVSENDPPFLVVHGTADPLVSIDQSDQLVATLENSGCDVTYIKIENGGHGGFASDELLQRVSAFFDLHLHGADIKVPDGTLPQGNR
jgi:acetyl esterase/lipase